MADDIERLQALRYDTVPLRPVYESYNTAANTLVDLIHQSIDLTVRRPTSVEKQKVVVCAFLAAAQRAFSKEDGAVAIASKAEYWSHFPLVGVDIIKQVTNALIAGDFIKPVEGTGQRHFCTDEDGKQRSMGLMRIYTLNESLSNVTPADVYFGRAKDILRERETIKKQTIQQRLLQHQKQAA